MKASSLLIMFVSFFIFCAQVQVVSAQEKKGKLGDFEDAAKGKKGSNDDDDDDDDHGWFGFFVNIILSDDGSSDDDDHYGFDDEREISFGAFPFDRQGMIHDEYDTLTGKSFLGRFSGGYQNVSSDITGLRINGQLQFSSKHGLHFDFISYTEDLDTRTDKTQVIGVNYRHLLFAENAFLLGGNIGLIVINPDKFEDSIWGLNFAADAQWFFANPFSLNARIGFAPIVEYMFQNEPPAIWDLQIGAGIHFNNVELYGAYKTLIPTINTNASIYGPEIGLRFWF